MQWFREKAGFGTRFGRNWAAGRNLYANETASHRMRQSQGFCILYLVEEYRVSGHAKVNISGPRGAQNPPGARMRRASRLGGNGRRRNGYEICGSASTGSK